MQTWWRTVKVGDVLKSPNGSLRIVRQVSGQKYGKPNKVWLVFVIRRCSWTHRPYTHYNAGELMRMGYKHTGVNLKLNTKFDRDMAREIAKAAFDPREFDCCDVRGIA